MVLGEMHAAWAAGATAATVAAHPDPVRLRRALRADLRGESIYPLLPLDWPRTSSRLAFALESAEDPQLGFSPAPGADPDRLIPISAMTVRRTETGLAAFGPDGRRWPLIEVFGRLLSELAVEAFKAVDDAPHTPRITVDRLVVARESWRTTVADCPVTDARGERAEYLAVRRWKATHGLPEYVFVKVPGEVKPIFADLTCPTYASMLASMLRQAPREGSLSVTEMLPTPDLTWLPDAAGHRYVAELRVHMRDDREATL